jgi:hypothetical protein
MKKVATKPLQRIYTFPGLLHATRTRAANENGIPMLGGILKNCALMSIALFVVYLIQSLL